MVLLCIVAASVANASAVAVSDAALILAAVSAASATNADEVRAGDVSAAGATDVDARAADESTDAPASVDVLNVASASVADVIAACMLLSSYFCMLEQDRAWIQESDLS